MAQGIDLTQEIQRLEKEKKTLTLRVQGVEVLGKVLQESQEENAKLRQEVTELRRNMGIEASQSSLQTTPSMQPTRCFLSQCEDNSPSLTATSSYEPFEMVHSGQSVIMGSYPSVTEEKMSTPGAQGLDFHIKDLSNGVKTIKDQTQHLLHQAQEMYSVIPTVTNPQEKQKLFEKIEKYCDKVGKHARDVNTREKLLQGLASQEEQLKEKVLAMGNEQVSQERDMDNLKLEVKQYTEELQTIKDEIKLLSDAVVVDKEDISLESMPSSNASTSTSTSTNNTSTSVKKEDEGRLDSEVTVTRPSCERCFELIKQLNQAVKQKKEAERQKEEILDVNHAWDTQYKKLKSETSKEIKELKQQVDFFKTADSQRKYETMRNTYKKVIDDERTMKEKALEDKRIVDEKVKQLEEEIKKMSLQIREQQMLPRTPGLAYSIQATPLSSLAAQAGESSDVVREVEVLKQQLRIYADDFNCERQDRERMQGEKERLENELKESKETITMLEEQLRLFQEDFRKESEEKDRLRRQLLTNRDVVGEPESRLGEMTRKVQAVAERQARMRALRDEYDREERLLLQEQQNLQQRSRVMALHPESQLVYSQQRYPNERTTDRYPTRRYEPLRPRGARSSDDMFYGGDVQPDTRAMGREVIDSPANEPDLTCPHCFRSFPPQNVAEYTSHLDRCME